jgi:hypothetical protein
MKHPTPSDFVIDVTEAHVSVVFKPSESHYSFGRLADPDDIARYGPGCRVVVRLAAATVARIEASKPLRLRRIPIGVEL